LGSVTSHDCNLSTDLLEQRVERNASSKQRLAILAGHEQQPTAILALAVRAMAEQFVEDLALPRAQLDQLPGGITF
jgi:hypothetical protein